MKQAFLDDVVTTIMMEEIPLGLVLNWDQIGMIVPSTLWTMDQCGVNQVDMVGMNDKQQFFFFFFFCGALVSKFFLSSLFTEERPIAAIQGLIFHQDGTSSIHQNIGPFEDAVVQYGDNIIVSYVDTIGEKLDNEEAAALVIMDNFKG